MRFNTNLTQKQMVKMVDNFLVEIGVPNELLGLKTNADKVLYYWNHLNPDNLFRGILELPNEYYIQLANLLCNTTERMKLFREKFYYSDGDISKQLRQFRRHLLDSRGKDNEAVFQSLQIVINNECWEALHTILQELFLEPISDDIFNRIVDLIHKGLNANDLYVWMKEDRNIKSLVTFNLSYIHSITRK
jgi:hypothetical protein